MFKEKSIILLEGQSRTLIAALVPLLLAGPITGQGPPAPIATPDAHKILKEACDALKEVKTFKVHLNSIMSVTAEGYKQELYTDFDLAVQRPGKVALKLTKGYAGLNLFSNGKTMFAHIPLMAVYAEEKAPKDLGSLFQSIQPLLGRMGMTGLGFLPPLLLDDPYQRLMEDVRLLEYVRRVDLFGRTCHVLRGHESEVAWDIWIADDATHDILRFLSEVDRDPTDLPTEMPGLKDMKMLSELRFSNWEKNPVLPDTAFAYQIPPGTKQIHSIFGGRKRPDHRLVGKPAPPLDLPSFDGKRFRLSDHRGKDVVILEFWATWCGPCVASLSELSALADSYKSQGLPVAFYAVNLREPRPLVQDFLKKVPITLTVLMDEQADAAFKYQVEPIPMAVVINREGTVHAVHTGFRPGLWEVWRKDIDQLLSKPGTVDLRH